MYKTVEKKWIQTPIEDLCSEISNSYREKSKVYVAKLGNKNLFYYDSLTGALFPCDPLSGGRDSNPCQWSCTDLVTATETRVKT